MSDPGSTATSGWDDIEPLLDAYLDQEDDDARRQWLEELRSRDAPQAERLARLLEGDEPDQRMRSGLRPLMEEALDAIDGAEPLEGRVGAWQLEEEIGRGGMGRVYRATRADGQYRQTVALKVMSERLGDRQMRQRFLNERQILARLAHPNVAGLVDGGVLDDGRPYFAMEMVRGAPILRFADEEALDVRQRAMLLVQLCRGIEYAHRNLVIHRDIKPSNVLVTRTGIGARGGTTADGVDDLHLVKLLDFGIAKMTDRDGTTTLQTLAGFRPMTFEYASPEQVRGDDVTTSSDLYSLGLVAYELFSGCRPFEVRSGSLSSVARIADDSNPAPRASARFAALAGEQQRAVADARRTTASGLLKVLRVDLDHLLEKCLRKRPEDRYESAVELRRDLERFLQGMPLRARIGSRRYRMQKLVARNRLLIGAALAVGVSLLAGVTGILLQASATAKERDRALAAESRSSAINRFLLDDLLSTAAPENSRGREITVVDALEESSVRAARQFRDQPMLESEVRGTIGDVYLRLGRTDEAEQHLHAALDAALRTDDGERRARALRRMAALEVARGEPQKGRELLEQALELARDASGPDALPTLVTRADLARTTVLIGERLEGRAEQEAVLAALERHHPRAWRERLSVMSDLTTTYVDLRETTAAEELATRTLDLQRRHLGPDHPDLVPTLQQLAAARLRAGRPLEALRVLEQAHDLSLRVRGPESVELVRLDRSMVGVYRDLFEYGKALAIAERALERARAVEGEDGLLTANMLNAVGVLHGDIGNQAEAAEHYRLAADRFARLVGEDSPTTLRALRNLEVATERLALLDPRWQDEHTRVRDRLLETERRVAADEDIDSTLLADIANDFVWRSRSPDDIDFAVSLAQRAVDNSGGENWEALQALGRALAADGQLAAALAASRTALQFPGALNSMALEREIPEMLLEAGAGDRIEPFLRELLERRRSERTADDPLIGVTQLWLARWTRDLGSAREAEDWYRQAIDQLSRTQPDHAFRLVAARSELGALLLETGRIEEAAPLVLGAMEELLPRPRMDREQQIATVERAIRLRREQGRTQEAAELERNLASWRRLPIHAPWRPDPSTATSPGT